MNKFSWLCFVVPCVVAACAPDSKNLERKVDALAAQIEALDKKLSAGAMARGPQPGARPRRVEPEPSQVFAVPVAGLPARGSADALVTIVEGYEYACPACNAARQTVAQTLEKYGDKVRVIYKPYIVHPDVATDASLAVCAAHRQGKFEKMDVLLWEKAFGKRDFSAKNVETIAGEAGLDMGRYAKDVTACRDEVKRHESELRGFGQGATPTFFVNGRYVLGAAPDKLHAIVDQELALAEQRIKAGTARGEYYRAWVLDKGEKKFEPKPPAAGS